MNRTFIALLLAIGASCKTNQTASDPLPTESQPIHITVVGTNDLHGWIFPQKTRLPNGVETQQGGLAAFAGYLDILRRENRDGVVLLDGGDLFQGTLVSNLSEGAVVINAFNALGYDAAAIGNHEFDFGPVGLESTALRPGEDPIGALKERIRQAKFPLLSANIFDAQAQTRPKWLGNDGTVIVQRKGVRIGIFGLTTTSTPVTTNPLNVKALRFAPLAPEAVQAAQRLRDRGAEVVIAVAHAGGRCASTENPHDVSSCAPDEEIFQMLNSIPTGTVDAVVAGHTHFGVGHFVNGTPVIETHALGRSFGIIDMEIGPKDRHVVRDRTRIAAEIPICEYVDESTKTCSPEILRTRAAIKLVPATFHGAPIQPNAAITAMFEPALRSVAELQRQPIGVKVPAPLLRNRAGESTLGDVLADSVRSLEGADIALLNPGGIRADFPAGDLTYGTVFETLPFDNNIATLKISGRQVRELLRFIYGNLTGIYQLSGVEVALSKCPGPDRLKTVRMADGSALRDAKQYRLVTTDFLARGGDGLGRVISTFPPESIDYGTSRSKSMRDELADYWKKKGRSLVAPVPGRITFVDNDAPCSDKTPIRASE